MQLIISCITGVLHRRQIRCPSNPKLNPIPNPELAYHQALRRDTSWSNGNPCASTQYLMVESSPRYCMAFSACVKHSIGCACSPCAATRPTPFAIADQQMPYIVFLMRACRLDQHARRVTSNGTSSIKHSRDLEYRFPSPVDTTQPQSPRNRYVVNLLGRLGGHDRRSLALPAYRQKTIAATTWCYCHSPTALLRDHSRRLKASKHGSTARLSGAPQQVCRTYRPGESSSV